MLRRLRTHAVGWSLRSAHQAQHLTWLQQEVA